MRLARILALPLLLFVVAAAGCDLASVQVRITEDVVTPGSNEQHSTDSNIAMVGVDLADDSDWKEHKDNIKSVDAAGFVLRIHNNRSEAATGRLYMSANPIANPSLTILANQATLILDGLAVPGNTSVELDFEDSLALEVNRTLLHEQMLTGKIFVYGVGEGAPFDVTIDQFTVVVVVTVGS